MALKRIAGEYVVDTNKIKFARCCYEHKEKVWLVIILFDTTPSCTIECASSMDARHVLKELADDESN